MGSHRIASLLLASVLGTGAGGTVSASPVGAQEPASTPAGSAVKSAISDPPVPLSPKGVSRSDYVSDEEFVILSRALDAADDREWAAVRAHLAELRDPTARDIVTWRIVIARDSQPTLGEVASFMQAHPDWPRQYLMRRRAEEALLLYPASDQDRLAWFAEHPPETAEGQLLYADALFEVGQADIARQWIAEAWIEGDFEAEREREILEDYRRYLDDEAHAARLDRLLWQGQSQAARRTARLLGEGAEKITDARIRLMSGRMPVEDALAQVPQPLLRDPGLIFQQARQLRRDDEIERALPLMLEAPVPAASDATSGDWWTERRILSRDALAAGKFDEAYQLAAAHGQEEGVSFAEGEFLAGWLALQKLNKPELAATHFARLEAGVSTPISLGRAIYWQGRAAAAAGDRATAMTFYAEAASYPSTFYGQLAAAELQKQGMQSKAALGADPTPDANARERFESRELVRVLHMLGEQYQPATIWIFVTHMAETWDDPDQLALLADLARDLGQPNLSVRVAKMAAARNIILPDRAWPTDVMPAWQMAGPPVESALVYGLARQESEFNADAVSHAGARGLMQLMPGTARDTAAQIDMPYSLSRLTEDPAYNATLGSAHLGDLVAGYDGSYILSLAAYNAGARRVSEWVEIYGDPRDPSVDAIDWIESIPYTETRNYVQRVLENVSIYREKLKGTGASGPAGRP